MDNRKDKSFFVVDHLSSLQKPGAHSECGLMERFLIIKPFAVLRAHHISMEHFVRNPSLPVTELSVPEKTASR